MTVENNDKVLQDIRDILLESKKTISTAESVTSGNLQVFLSHAKDASKFFQGGITTYNLGQKYKHLSVEPIHAEECDCVSESVAQQMALETCKLFRSNYGLGITGYASRQPEKNINDLYAYIAIAENDKILLSERLAAESEDSIKIQEFYSLRLLERFSHVCKLNTMEKKKEKPETTSKAEIEKETMKPKDDSAHKGYNEKNPAQPQGAFTPDSKTGKK